MTLYTIFQSEPDVLRTRVFMRFAIIHASSCHTSPRSYSCVRLDFVLSCTQSQPQVRTVHGTGLDEDGRRLAGASDSVPICQSETLTLPITDILYCVHMKPSEVVAINSEHTSTETEFEMTRPALKHSA